MPEFKDLQSAAGLAQLNDYLSTRSYIEGFQASGADSCVACQLKAIQVDSKYSHINRWLAHILSFPPCTRSRWAGSKCASKESAECKKECPAGGKKEEEEEEEEEEEDDDDMKMSLDSDDDDDGAAAIIAKKAAEKAAADAGKDGAKPKKQVIAKSTLVLDVKPEDSDTDLADVEKRIRAIQQEGLLWGACERIPVAYGIFKLRIVAVVVDDLVSTDSLQEEIESFESVQSTDIHAFNKI